VPTQGQPGNSVASGWQPVGSHALAVQLEPGEEKTFVFVPGLPSRTDVREWEKPGIINKKRARALIEPILDGRAGRGCSRKLRDHWTKPPVAFPDHVAGTRSSTGWETSGTPTSAWSPSTCRARLVLRGRASVAEWASAIRTRPSRVRATSSPSPRARAQSSTSPRRSSRTGARTTSTAAH